MTSRTSRSLEGQSLFLDCGDFLARWASSGDILVYYFPKNLKNKYKYKALTVKVSMYKAQMAAFTEGARQNKVYFYVDVHVHVP